MDKFFYRNNRIVNDEQTYGSGGVGINLSGSDWLGLGELFGGMSQGTVMCGARPIVGGKDRDDWEECNKNAMVIAQQQLGVQQSQIKSLEEIEKRKRITIIVIVSLVSVALITTVFLVIRRKRRKAS